MHPLSVREVEVIVGVVVVLALAEAGEDEVEGEGDPRESRPDADAEIDNPSLDDEVVGAAVHEVEEPLLGRLRPVVVDVASSVRGLLVEILLAIPRTVLHLGDSEAFTVDQPHVLHVAEIVVSQAATLGVHFY